MNRSRLAFANFGARYEFNPTFGPVILNVRPTRRSIFAYHLDEKLQHYLSECGISWTLMDESERFATEVIWRRVYGRAFQIATRIRRGAKAECEYVSQPREDFYVAPFTENVLGTPMNVRRRARGGQMSISGYRCNGRPVPLHEFCDAEFFISPLNFDWTMIHTHEDYAIDGPYFIRREWLPDEW